MSKNILITSFNNRYYNAGITLIASIHRTSLDVVHEIIVYNLGLSRRKIEFLRQLERVKVVDYPTSAYSFYDDYMLPKVHGYKLFAVWHAGIAGGNILWLDAGVLVLRSLKIIYDLIETQDIFMVVDKEQINRRWCSPPCLKHMNATKREIDSPQLSSGILGYKSGGVYRDLIEEAFRYSTIEGILPLGDQYRHDQSIYSILAARYNCPTSPIEIFGEWRGILRKDQVIYVHRRRYHNEEGLVYSG